MKTFFRKSSVASLSTLLIGLIILSVGCGPSVINKSKKDLLLFKDKPEIQAVLYQPPPLKIRSQFEGIAYIGGGRNLFGDIMNNKMADDEGKKWIKNFSLEDPALRIRDHFIASLEAEHDFKNIHVVQGPNKKDDFKELKKSFGNGVILDFKTSGWTVKYYPFIWYSDDKTPWYFIYSIRARLINLEDSKVIWEAGYTYDGKARNDKYSMKTLKADSGALFKEKLSEAADTCAMHLVADFSR